MTEESKETLPLSPEEMRRILEAVLFASGAPMKYEKLGEVLSLTAGEAKQLVRSYANEYNSESIPRGVQILLYDDSCQMCTKESYEPYIRKALGITREGGNLSNSSLETLAVIAYNQPVTRAFVEQVRGVDSSYAISVLLDRNLIEKAGRLDVPGKPNLYATTPDFLRVFGLESVEQLPQIDLTELGGVPKA
ncbi:MAG: SMC-Scp complex subunit ScpB [Ruminococcaceae bacterium]|nr:SMC-Scp complex subunit ScpB [Oscillospiraceae bacterium]